MSINLKDSNYQRLFYIYFTLMVLIYGGYVLLFNYRMNMSEVWGSKNLITSKDSATIGQLGQWSENLEVLFIFIFIGMVLFCFFKRKSDSNIFRKFFVVNAFLSFGIVISSLVLSQITSLPLMNFMLPLINLAGIFILLLVYLSLEWFIKYKNLVSRA
ncbi:hypothetical protein [Sutcliffiella deserti]|uniref:hypothetical protein n=1 Tax=Sutcliffiella deserti TaxID=2875501 RepID=UPI001CC0C4CB|nr:hypothetical protein [Sutcliffiella deserti]